MSIWIFYQPIDVEAIQQVVFPYVLGSGELDVLLRRCKEPSRASAALQPYRNAYAAKMAGVDYIDPDWGCCDPTEFLAPGVVRHVLEFARHVWPSWSVKAICSCLLLPKSFPVLEHFQMPIALFQPLADEIPEIGLELQTIADAAQIMGGVIPKDHVQPVREAVRQELQVMTRDPEDPCWFDAAKKLLAALTYAQQNRLSFTEAIE